MRQTVGNFLPTIPAKAWEPYGEELTPEGKIELNLGSFLVRSSGKTILVDTGLGTDSSRFEDAQSGRLLEDMRARGARPDDIDMVLITHLHPDHVGWNLTPEGGAFRPTFPNARYWVSRVDWDYFTARARIKELAYIKDAVTPLEELGVLELMDGEQALTDELTSLPTPGHTPGHTSVLVTSKGERGIIVGDAAHLPLQAHETDWCPRADIDPERSRATRRSLMERAEGDGSLLISGHFPAPGFGRIVRLKGRRYWKAG